MSDVKFKRLRGRIIEKYGSYASMCNSTGINQSWLSLKLSGKREMRISDMHVLCDCLDISFENEVGYFFAE